MNSSVIIIGITNINILANYWHQRPICDQGGVLWFLQNLKLFNLNLKSQSGKSIFTLCIN